MLETARNLKSRYFSLTAYEVISNQKYLPTIKEHPRNETSTWLKKNRTFRKYFLLNVFLILYLQLNLIRAVPRPSLFFLLKNISMIDESMLLKNCKLLRTYLINRRFIILRSFIYNQEMNEQIQ